MTLVPKRIGHMNLVHRDATHINENQTNDALAYTAM